MSYEEKRLISYNYNELGQEFGDLIVDIRNERDKYKEVLDKIKKISNQVKEAAKEVENEWAYQVMEEIDCVLEEI